MSTDTAIRYALAQLGKPYRWGATGPDAYDCSGLTMQAYAAAGISIGRTTYDQIDHGTAVAATDIAPGDLVFPEAGHVQLAIGNGRVVEAPRTGEDVRIAAVAWGGTPYAVRRIGAPGTVVGQFGTSSGVTSTTGPPTAWTGVPNLVVTVGAVSRIAFQPRPSESGA